MAQIPCHCGHGIGIVLIEPLAWEHPNATGMAVKSKKKKESLVTSPDSNFKLLLFYPTPKASNISPHTPGRLDCLLALCSDLSYFMAFTKCNSPLCFLEPKNFAHSGPHAYGPPPTGSPPLTWVQSSVYTLILRLDCIYGKTLLPGLLILLKDLDTYIPN